MKFKETGAEIYWREHGGEEWKRKMTKRASLPHYVNQLELIENVFKDIDFIEGRVLELGCGYGRVLQYLESKLGMQADGMDQSKKMLEVAVADGISKSRLTHANMRNISKRMKRYDIIYTCEALIHVHPYHLLGVLSSMLSKADHFVINIETSPTDKFYADDCHAGFWKHDYLGAYAMLGKTARVVFQEGTKHSAYIVSK